MVYRVKDLIDQHGERLRLELVAGGSGIGIDNDILVAEAHRPGLCLTGYLKNHAHKRPLVFGKVECEYLDGLKSEERASCLSPIVKNPTPLVIIARHYNPPQELIDLCQARHIPLLRTPMATMSLLSRLDVLLAEEFAPTVSLHGTLVEVFGIGVLIQGESAVGKSEAALGLIERGHRLVSDDVVKVRRRDENHLVGEGIGLIRHHMEVRGIGIINVAHLYGAGCVSDKQDINIVVHLEGWDNHKLYDRVGLEEPHCEILGVQVPHHVLPVKPGRDVLLLLETITLNHRLKIMGYHAAKEFCSKQAKTIAQKQEKRQNDCATF